MSGQTDYSKLITGDPLKCIVRIKAPTNFQREDIKVIGSKDHNTISITDTNNRVLEEFDAQEAYGPEFSLVQIFENSVKRYLYPFIQGFSVSVFAFGSSGSGKSQTIEGNRKEPGLINLVADQLFTILEDKKHQTNNVQTGNMQNYTYAVRCRFIEVLDEEIYDLFGRPGKNLQDTCHVVESIWEGPSIQNATWVNVNNRAQIGEILASGVKSRNGASNEFGKLSSKATGMFTIELLQTSELDTMEQLVLISRMNFYDLPASEILLDDPETIRVRQGSSLNKSVISLGALLKDLSARRNDYVIYETSVLTHLMKDALGGNSLTVGIFNLQNGDAKASSLSLNFMKYARNVMNWPVVNDGKELGLLKKFRAEVNAAKNNRLNGSMMGNDMGIVNPSQQMLPGAQYNDKGQVIELEKKLIENHLDKMRQADDKQRLANKLAELRDKFNIIVREKGDLQGELIKCEEEKLEVSKALVELQIENTKLMEIIQNEKYDANNKLLNAENDILAVNIKEEKAMKQVQELQDRLKDIVEEKRELEIEFVALKKNFMNLNQQVEEEKLKNQNIGMELINMVNENKALHDEMNDVYKKTGATTDENQKFINKIEKQERENQEQREALVFAKAEIERLKTEMLKYDIQDQQHRLEMDQKRIEMEKGYVELTKDKQMEFGKMNQKQETDMKKMRDDKLYWESQKMELTHKNKLAQRKIGELEDRIVEVQRNNDEITAESNKLLLQMDEMRSIYRQKLIQFTTEQNKQGEKPTRIGYDLSAREELIRTYTEKEIELNEKLEQQRRQRSHQTQEVKALKVFSKQLKYLAEDWAPVGVPLPEILVREPPVHLDDAFNNNNGMVDTEEVDRLRKKNRKLEEDLKILQEQVQNGVYRNDSQSNLQQRLVNEIQTLKGEPDIIRRPGSSTLNNEQLRKERNELQEENRRLISMLKDNRKWDVYLLQRDNERLLKAVKEGETGAVGPSSGGDQNLRQKIAYYEKMVKQMEKERSELMVRSTMAEEQLKSLQEHLQKTTLDYQKKIVELKKSNARSGQLY